jgi:hypothetical protein
MLNHFFFTLEKILRKVLHYILEGSSKWCIGND